MEKIPVLIADDHYIVRLGLKILINSFDDFYVVGEAENGQEVLDQIEKTNYVILDLEMPSVSGIETLEILRDKHPEKRVVILTNSMDIPTLLKAKKLKPHGFLFKDSMHDEIKICLQQIKLGNLYEGRNCRAFFERHRSEIEETEHLMRNLAELTKTEIRVLSKISENLSTAEIAEDLFNSPKTIDNHRTNIAKKLDISGYNNLQALAIKYTSLIKKLVKNEG
ncbi:response regulator transcription factor [Flavobacteriaceae bacterium F08102]|nr:response regulator transcription factor [Flavobacteriaceae bacterium F08102]